MAEAIDLKWRVTEIAICAICLEDCRNSKMLPCVHSFCLECLQGHCKDKEIGDDVACPVCRKEFQIPEFGLEGLPYNFFLQNLIDARDASSEEEEEVLCEVCEVENDEDEGEISPATMYCVDCNQKLCKSCSRPHRNWRGGEHQVRPLGVELNAELIQQRGSYCDQHKDERLKLYCHDCQMTVCLMCFAITHTKHHCDDIENVAGEFLKLFDADISSISARIDGFHAAVAQVDAENTKFASSVDETGTFVHERGKAVNQVTQKHMKELLQKLQIVETNGVKEASNRSEELKLALTSLESFEIYLAELMSKGSPCDITRAAKTMRCRASELLQTHVIPADYRSPSISFTPMNIDELTTGGQNLIGRINWQTGLSGSELRLQTVRERELEKQLKLSAQREQLLKDEIIQFQQQLHGATDRETSLQQQVKQSQTHRQEAKTMQELLRQQIEQSQTESSIYQSKLIRIKGKIKKVAEDMRNNYGGSSMLYGYGTYTAHGNHHRLIQRLEAIADGHRTKKT